MFNMNTEEMKRILCYTNNKRLENLIVETFSQTGFQISLIFTGYLASRMLVYFKKVQQKPEKLYTCYNVFY